MDLELNKLIAEDVSEEKAIKTSPNQPLRFLYSFIPTRIPNERANI